MKSFKAIRAKKALQESQSKIETLVLNGEIEEESARKASAGLAKRSDSLQQVQKDCAGCTQTKGSVQKPNS